ncbi:MAG TPA: flavodoxin-dependent (E)-4-hydroxy-3-methylbut-2-enyl-diphosphate synthase [Syntrophales bacterium]|nr:flavodoxin-dependent (E)-4-hydroxy-3-methylbut-2-enyl-diphosphate synthase [Syntrophales bacterium]
MSEPAGINRKKTRRIKVGTVPVGGNAPVSVQSMTSTDTRDVKATVAQIDRLEQVGCEIIRVAVLDEEAAVAIKSIKKKIGIPLIADIHFNHRLAIAALENGAAAVRVNPGNLGREKIREVVAAAKALGASMRIGINSGSLEKSLLKKYGGPRPEALVESALASAAFLEDLGFRAFKLSLKSSDVPTMIRAYRLVSEKTDIPLHLGVTEAGGLLASSIKSSIGIGALLAEGIGDTIRVSVTGDPAVEMTIAYGILRALGIRKVGPDIIACPTCGRCEIDLAKLVEKVEKRLAGMKEYLKIAIMGCVVNGPGEAAEADIGIAGGRGHGILFKRGKPVRKVKEKELLEDLLMEIEAMKSRRGKR